MTWKKRVLEIIISAKVDPFLGGPCRAQLISGARPKNPTNSNSNSKQWA